MSKRIVRYPKVEEVFGEPYLGSLSNAREPRCLNDIVSVKRYRITVEEVTEPVEAVQDRIRLLWRRCENSHHRNPLRKAAKDVGIELDWSDYGVDVPRKRST